MSGDVKRGARFSAVPGRAYRDTAMTPKLRDVLGALGYYASQDGNCVVKVRTLSALLGGDEANLRGYITKLVKLGYVQRVERTAADGRQLASSYRILYDADLPPERDRAATEPTVMVDLDEVADPEEQGPGGLQGEGGTQYHPPQAVSATPTLAVSATPLNTVLANTKTYPHGPAAGAAGPLTATPATDQGPGSTAPSLPGLGPDQLAADPVGAIFDAWQSAKRANDGPAFRPSRLTAERARVIRAALKDWPVEELVLAAQGWRWFPEHNGQGTDGRKWDQLNVVLRDKHVEKFRDAEHDPAARPAATAPTGAQAEQERKARRMQRAMGQATGLAPTSESERRQIGAGGAA